MNKKIAPKSEGNISEDSSVSLFDICPCTLPLLLLFLHSYSILKSQLEYFKESVLSKVLLQFYSFMVLFSTIL